MFCTNCGKQQPDKQRPTHAETGAFADYGARWAHFWSTVS